MKRIMLSAEDADDRITTCHSEDTVNDNSIHGMLIPLPPFEGTILRIDSIVGPSASMESVSTIRSNTGRSVDHMDTSISASTGSLKQYAKVFMKPGQAFSYFILMPKLKQIPLDLEMSQFTDIKHLADGSNANVFLVKYKGKVAIMKMIREDKQTDSVAAHEFDVEHGLLERVNHPNIVNILGAGRVPRRFLLLEYLSGGTMKTVFEKVAKKSSLSKLFSSGKSFSFLEMLLRGREIASGLNYLHNSLNGNAILIHRDLKPDNVAFDGTGRLVLFDLGLSTIISRTELADTTYEMTGQTGSLRYMAPEVALGKSYNEKVDLFSFGILLWQMATGEVPFKGASKADYLKVVARGGMRPTLVASWPREFQSLLSQCWDSNFIHRPTFGQVIFELDSLITRFSK